MFFLLKNQIYFDSIKNSKKNLKKLRAVNLKFETTIFNL